MSNFVAIDVENLEIKPYPYDAYLQFLITINWYGMLQYV